MFQRLFGRDRDGNRAITEALYAEIVAAARRPELYSEWEVPDTPLGRFEMLSLHMFLFQHRVHGEVGALREIAQILTDDFFAEVEHSLRDLGIGDMGVPKRMKKLARMFYGRTAAYADALARKDRPALTDALARNVRPDSPTWPQAESLALYVFEVDNSLRKQPSEAIRHGEIQFPQPESGRRFPDRPDAGSKY